MIYVGTNLKALDNSGANIVKCIGIIGPNNPKFSGIGDIVVVTVKNTGSFTSNVRNKVNKGSICYALVVQTKKNKRFLDNLWTNFINNGVVLIDNKNNLLFTRVKTPISYILRFKRFVKVLSLSKYVL